MKKNNFFQITIIVFTLLLSQSCEKSNDLDVESESVAANENVYSFIFNGKNYEVVKEAKSWGDAVSYAIAHDGYLIEINSLDEQNAIYTELINNANITFSSTSNKFGYAAVWMGGNDIHTEGVWMWDGDNNGIGDQFWEGEIDGSPVNGLYNNWGNEPDNNGDQDAVCIGIEITPINAAGKWTDLDGSLNTLFFIVEYD